MEEKVHGEKEKLKKSSVVVCVYIYIYNQKGRKLQQLSTRRLGSDTGYRMRPTVVMCGMLQIKADFGLLMSEGDCV